MYLSLVRESFFDAIFDSFTLNECITKPRREDEINCKNGFVSCFATLPVIPTCMSVSVVDDKTSNRKPFNNLIFSKLRLYTVFFFGLFYCISQLIKMIADEEVSLAKAKSSVQNMQQGLIQRLIYCVT